MFFQLIQLTFGKRLFCATAYKFSFLLFIPAVIGATIATASESRTLSSNVDASNLILGFVSLKLLRKTMFEGKFHVFTYYCWTASLLVILVQILEIK